MAQKPKEKDDAMVVKEAAGLPAMAADFAADAGAGFEEVDGSCFMIPRLKLLQDMSKARQKASTEYVKGAEEGMFHNTVDNSLYDGKEGFLAVLCHFRKKFIEFEGTVGEGGGYVREYNLAEGTALLAQCVRDAEGNDRLPNSSHILVDIRDHFIVMLHPETGEPLPVVLSMASSSISVSKKWMSMAQSLKRDKAQPGPDATYTHLWRVTAVPANKKGHDYFAPKVEYVCGLDPSEGSLEYTKDPDFVYKSAKHFADMVKSGGAKIAEPAEGDDRELF